MEHPPENSAGSSERHLFVGDTHDIPALRRHIADLPANAYGRVIVEVASPVQIEDWQLPEGMCITWLLRERGFAGLPGMARRSELSARALDAWIDEWVTETAGDEPPWTIWIGCTSSRAITERFQRLQRLLNEHDTVDHERKGMQ